MINFYDASRMLGKIGRNPKKKFRVSMSEMPEKDVPGFHVPEARKYRFMLPPE